MKTYVIINVNEVSSINFNEVLVTSPETMVYNKDKTKAIVKYEGDQPSFLSGKTEYTHAQMRSIVTDVDGEWYTPSPE